MYNLPNTVLTAITSLIHTDLTDEELREKEYNNYEQRRKEAK